MAVISPDGSFSETLAARLERAGCDTRGPAAIEGCASAILAGALFETDPLATSWDLLETARKLRAGGTRELVFLQDTGGCFRFGGDGGWRGGVAGLARTARREWPDMVIRLIDIPARAMTPDEIGKAVLAGLACGVEEVGICGESDPLIPGHIRASTPGKACPAQEPGTWIVSGGARGVTSDCVMALARRTGGRFALLGRSGLAPWPEGLPQGDDLGELRKKLAQAALARGEKPRPAEIDATARHALAGREIRDTLSAIEAAGGQAAYLPCDIADPEAVARAVREAEARFGPVTGLIHGAGVIADRRMSDKTFGDFAKVYRTKIDGLSALLGAVDTSKLTHIALFSSAAAAFGNPGQCDYALANEALNRVAHKLRADLPGARVKSFNWGPWDGGMVSEAHARHFEALGVALIPRPAGADFFAGHLLCGDPEEVELLVGEPWPA
mgnify:CR=1 FL=1